MHWLPLVAMVIASALPIPHNPVTVQPGLDSRREDNAKLSTHKETSTSILEDRIVYKPFSSSGSRDRRSLDAPAQQPLRAEEISEDNSSSKDNGASRKDDSVFLDFSQKDSQMDSTDSQLRHLSPSGRQRDASTTGTGAAEDIPAQEAGTDSLLEIDEMYLDAHPRVLFSSSETPPDRPPLLLMLENDMMEDDWDGEEQEDADGRIEGHGDRATEWSTTPPSWAHLSGRTVREALRPVRRVRRSHELDGRTGAKSVCQSESFWVNKTTAIDSNNRNVTVLQVIQTLKGPLKQVFFETRCRKPDVQSGSSRRPSAMAVGGASCLGVDKKQWNSECKEKQSYVRALTKDANNLMGWRWIRIDSSCVCVLLSRANQRKEVLTRRGRG